MERLTEKHYNGDGYYMKCSETCPSDCSEICDCEELDRIVDRLGAIEDILGDDYDLDRLSVLVNQRMTMREDVAARLKLVGGIPLDRLRELVEVWKDGPCALCMYRPPSSTDGKPCTMCPASRGEN